MIAVLAVTLALVVVPLVVLYICETAANKGVGPLADPTQMPVFDGIIMMPTMLPMVVSMASMTNEPANTEPVSGDPRDAEQCAAESRLVRRFLGRRAS